MRFPNLSIREIIREILIGVASVGLLLSFLWLAVRVTNPSAGPLASHLNDKDEVVTFDEVAAIVSEGSRSGMTVDLAGGTRCIVISDPAGDEDDCYSSDGRSITVRVDDGIHRGAVLKVARRNLRVKLKWYDLRTGR
jgi:hypothetical protein